MEATLEKRIDVNSPMQNSSSPVTKDDFIEGLRDFIKTRYRTAHHENIGQRLPVNFKPFSPDVMKEHPKMSHGLSGFCLRQDTCAQQMTEVGIYSLISAYSSRNNIACEDREDRMTVRLGRKSYDLRAFIDGNDVSVSVI